MISTIKEICKDNSEVLADFGEREKNYKIISSDHWEVKENTYQKPALYFKNVVETINSTEIEKRIPMLKGIGEVRGFNIPWMVDGLEKIDEAVKAGRKIGISGGPCLFGEHEVDVIICLKDKRTVNFDYSTGKNYLEEHEFCNTTSDLNDFLVNNRENIADIRFEDKKDGITNQEYYSIKYLFDLGKMLDAKVYIPIPDMSYIKYLRFMMAECADRELADRAVKDLSDIAYRITDMYIDFVDTLSKEYPGVEYLVIHERDTKGLEKYYKNREPYYQKHALMRTITGIPQKTESIKDYISMPAMPFFIDGITDVLQCDSLDETDSYRKCRKAVKGAVNIACMLYPEKISGDGENTIFHADKEYKEYITQ